MQTVGPLTGTQEARATLAAEDASVSEGLSSPGWALWLCLAFSLPLLLVGLAYAYALARCASSHIERRLPLWFRRAASGFATAQILEQTVYRAGAVYWPEYTALYSQSTPFVHLLVATILGGILAFCDTDPQLAEIQALRKELLRSQQNADRMLQLTEQQGVLAERKAAENITNTRGLSDRLCRAERLRKAAEARLTLLRSDTLVFCDVGGPDKAAHTSPPQKAGSAEPRPTTLTPKDADTLAATPKEEKEAEVIKAEDYKIQLDTRIAADKHNEVVAEGLKLELKEAKETCRQVRSAAKTEAAHLNKMIENLEACLAKKYGAKEPATNLVDEASKNDKARANRRILQSKAATSKKSDVRQSKTDNMDNRKQAEATNKIFDVPVISGPPVNLHFYSIGHPLGPSYSHSPTFNFGSTGTAGVTKVDFLSKPAPSLSKNKRGVEHHSQTSGMPDVSVEGSISDSKQDLQMGQGSDDGVVNPRGDSKPNSQTCSSGGVIPIASSEEVTSEGHSGQQNAERPIDGSNDRATVMEDKPTSSANDAGSDGEDGQGDAKEQTQSTRKKRSKHKKRGKGGKGGQL